MITNIGKITSAVVQRVGNKSNGDGIAFSSETCPMAEVEEHFKKLIKASFNFEIIKQFDAIDSVEFNPTFRFVTKIFENESCIVEQSNNLARHLYEHSIHPNIKVGEFYVVYFKDCAFDGNTVDAIGLFKSESRETVLKVQLENNTLRVSSEQGMSLKKMDKGCIIFNIDRNLGYKLTVVDNTNSGSDAHYWVDNFLHVTDCHDSYYNTIQVAEMCTVFVRELKKEDTDLYCAQKAKEATSLLSSDSTIDTDCINRIFCDTEEHTQKYEEFKTKYEQHYGKLPEEFKPKANAFKHKSVTKMNSFKLGSDFEIKILNPIAEVESGYDERRGKKYYKLYFDEEK